MVSDVLGRCLTSPNPEDLPGRLWEAVGSPGKLWEAPETSPGGSGRLWEALGSSRKFWELRRCLDGSPWEALGSSGRLWESLGKGLKKWTTRSILDLLYISLLRYLLKTSEKRRKSTRDPQRTYCYIPSYIFIKGLRKQTTKSIQDLLSVFLLRYLSEA